MKIIYGSSNKAKLQEVKDFFNNNNIDVVTYGNSPYNEVLPYL